jgi:hypothetical protein
MSLRAAVPTGNKVVSRGSPLTRLSVGLQNDMKHSWGIGLHIVILYANAIGFRPSSGYACHEGTTEAVRRL